MEKVRGEDNPADAFTKALDKNRMKRLFEMIGVRSVTAMVMRDSDLERGVLEVLCE